MLAPFLLNVLLVLSALLAGVSVFVFSRYSPSKAVWWLMAAALCLRLALASLDPFLHDWDERFHALVAKNLMVDWLRPVLRQHPVLPYDYRAWCCNHVWVHKQPLFLWQIAASFKLFGVNELALRLPSALLGALLLWPVYRLGRLVFSPAVGYCAAVLLTFAYYQLGLTTGRQSVDHSDVAFMAYVTASIWAWYEGQCSTSGKGRWALLVGVFSGAAVLCKWLPGAVVYAGWALEMLLNPKLRSRGEYARYGLAVAVAALLVLPWQLYINRAFPLESTFERHYAALHFTQALEDKAGPWYYYLNNLWYQYQWLVLLIAAGIGWTATPRLRPRPVRLLLTTCLIVFVFFSAAATKMVSYTYVVAPALLLLAALGWVETSRWLRRRGAWGKWAVAGLAVAVVLADLRPLGLLKHHTERFASARLLPERQHKLVRTAVYRRLDALVPAGYVVFNVPALEDTEAMFYSHRNVYSWWPTEEEYRLLRGQGMRMAAFSGRGVPQLPAYLQGPDVRIIDAALE
ncbi:phospholipid carrier-dependent glycosyltransferase [Hymenobacter busanensis]|uniref:Phospholipid carrier-dependent glycosyltransferase n=1 Tax=Hymenobacter busanensis TaxID=2607656 RepID=A0A7L4ZS39_9BACT|nr:glycosyltransferase family 39 protein [Hymenobacter busanensis]KAA9327582.1 phospholipid carrier-dependent glycosyltransferase [Hymenobacter busanensis]QHJ06079.1 phospholipid carrier-dependent glycosyltransferase [Hymenobacter busanensis]